MPHSEIVREGEKSNQKLILSWKLKASMKYIKSASCDMFYLQIHSSLKQKSPEDLKKPFKYNREEKSINSEKKSFSHLTENVCLMMMSCWTNTLNPLTRRDPQIEVITVA